MLEDKPKDAKDWKKIWDEKSKTSEGYERTFESRIAKELEWERLLKTYLPKDKEARILDAGGGNGRMTLPFAKLGYQVTLSDLSPGMLDVASERLEKEGLLGRVEIKEADLASLPFSDETFDLVICLHGAFSYPDCSKASKELTRVMRKGGRIIVDALNRYWAVGHELNNNPERAVKLLKSEADYTYDRHSDWMRAFNPEELKGLFEENGIKCIRIYGEPYSLLPNEILYQQEWDDKFLAQIVEIMTYLRDMPSFIGMAPELTLVGEKT
jgi:ubiquinone/menaquinone biosynthesis C-methylase UbiE